MASVVPLLLSGGGLVRLSAYRQSIRYVLVLVSPRHWGAASTLGVRGVCGCEYHRNRCGWRAQRLQAHARRIRVAWAWLENRSAAKSETSVRHEYSPKIQGRKNILRLPLQQFRATLAVQKRWTPLAARLRSSLSRPSSHPDTQRLFCSLESGFVVPRHHYRRHPKPDL